MKIKNVSDRILIDLTGAEAAVFLEELSNIRGGARLPKLRQVCTELETTLNFSKVVSKTARCPNCGCFLKENEA